MAGIWKDMATAVVADTVYSDGSLAARNCNVTLPEVTPTTVEVPVGGTIELPITGMTDAMEATVTLGAPDDGFAALCSPQSHEVEVRWVLDVLQSDGTKVQKGCKAFMQAYAKTIPGISLELASASENELTLGVTRYQLFMDGTEVLLIDQINNIFKVDGTDYAKDLAALL